MCISVDKSVYIVYKRQYTDMSKKCHTIPQKSKIPLYYMGIFIIHIRKHILLIRYTHKDVSRGTY